MAESEARPYVVERREVVAQTDNLRVSSAAARLGGSRQRQTVSCGGCRRGAGIERD